MVMVLMFAKVAAAQQQKPPEQSLSVVTFAGPALLCYLRVNERP
jgi:hypothetical protein